MISLNGSAARRALLGDLVIIAASAIFDDTELKDDWKPDLVFVDEHNKIMGRRDHSTDSDLDLNHRALPSGGTGSRSARAGASGWHVFFKRAPAMKRVEVIAGVPTDPHWAEAVVPLA